MVDAPFDESPIASLEMPRTAEEIAGRRFRARTRGYDRAEVEQFLAEVAADSLHRPMGEVEGASIVGRQNDPALDAIRAQLEALTTEVRALTTEVRALSTRVPSTPTSTAGRPAIAAWWPGESSLSVITKRRVSVGPAA
jgi:DivIVA domain-containing protein